MIALVIAIVEAVAILFLLIRKEEDEMAIAAVYATLILKGKKTLEEVPVKIKTQVEEILEILEV